MKGNKIPASVSKLFKENFFPRLRKKGEYRKTLSQATQMSRQQREKVKTRNFFGLSAKFFGCYRKGESSKRRWLESKNCSRKRLFSLMMIYDHRFTTKASRFSSLYSVKHVQEHDLDVL